MKTAIIKLSFLAFFLFSFSSADARPCPGVIVDFEIGKYTGAEGKTGGTCYKATVLPYQILVMTLRNKPRMAPFSVAFFKKPRIDEPFFHIKSKSGGHHVYIFPISSKKNYYFPFIYNGSKNFGKYRLNVREINFREIIVESLLLYGIESIAEGILSNIFGSNEKINKNEKMLINNMAVGALSILKNRDIGTMSRDIAINSIKQKIIGNGVVADFATHFANVLVNHIFYFHGKKW